MESCWVNERSKIQCTFSIHCYDTIKPEDLNNWITKGRYVTLSKGLSKIFENLVCPQQGPSVIASVNRLLELYNEINEFDKCKIRRKVFDFKLIDEIISEEEVSLIEQIKRERIFFNLAPKGLSEKLPILSSNHGFSYAILEDLREKRKEPEIVVIIDGHFDFYAYLTIPKVESFQVDKHIDDWAKRFNSRQELIAFLQGHKNKESDNGTIPINGAEWLRDCFFRMPNTFFVHIGADWNDTKFESNETMKRTYKIDVYPHLYRDMIMWSEKELQMKKLKEIIQNRKVYLSIDVDGVAGIPSTYSLAEPTRSNQISKRNFQNILRICKKYAKDIDSIFQSCLYMRKSMLRKIC